MKVPRLGGRPVYIADYSAEIEKSILPDEALNGDRTRKRPDSTPPKERTLRTHFPAAGHHYEGGESDGYCYRIVFSSGRFEASFNLLCDFLQEEGFQEVPLPQNVEELLRFRLPPRLRHQLSIFGDNGYVHNPIKILFPLIPARRGELILEVYNVAHDDHLLRFHRR